MLSKLLIHLTFLSLFFIIGIASIVHAQTGSPTEVPPTQAQWVVDESITFMGRQTAIGSEFFDRVIQEQHSWVGNTPLPFILLVIVSISFFALRRQNKTLANVPQWARIVLIATFSYASLLVLYQFLNLLQSIILSPTLGTFCPSTCISQKDFIYAGLTEDFVGKRLVGDMFNDEVALNVLLTRLTALTYYAMVLVIILQKIILMIFLIISPFILIALTRPTVTKMTKVLTREFLRWIVATPLFALSLTLTAFIWSTIFPSMFVWLGKFLDSETVWPTASTILLGYPSQWVTPSNHVNTPEALTFYIISLTSMWIAIIVPWILAHIIARRVSKYPWRDHVVINKILFFVSGKDSTKNDHIS